VTDIEERVRGPLAASSTDRGASGVGRPEAPGNLPATDAKKTYRYLRLGMVVAVAVLTAAILIEQGKAHCWQTSISAYYYTPVRAIFVGGLFAVGFALIVVKGRTTWEDVCLNGAGLLAPVVALAPTTDVGRCWSVQPEPLPVMPDGSLAGWVVTNIDSNFYALLVAGAVGLGVAAVVAVAVNRSLRAPVKKEDRGTTLSLAATGLVLLLGWWAIERWDEFYTRAHGFSAVLMFVFLIGAVGGRAFDYRATLTTFSRIYTAIAAAMVVVGIVVPWFRIGDEHTVFVLEAAEIVLFAGFWLVQTSETWDDKVVLPDGTPVPSGPPAETASVARGGGVAAPLD
jgi:hypothetical protein